MMSFLKPSWTCSGQSYDFSEDAHSNKGRRHPKAFTSTPKKHRYTEVEGGLTLKRSSGWMDQTLAIDSKHCGKGSRSGRMANDECVPMWSSRFLWYTYRGCPLTVSQVSCALPWNHSSHSRSGGSLAVCALQSTHTLLTLQKACAFSMPISGDCWSCCG